MNNKRSSNKQGGNRRYKKYRGGPKRNQETGVDKFTKKFTHLVEQHQQNRRKYFHEFHHHDPNRVNKLRRAFERSAKELRDWQDSLPTHLKERFSEEVNLDLTYSENRNIDGRGEDVAKDAKFGDPHYLKSQEESSYSEDQEESIGTMDDYRSYKGLS